MFMLIVVSGEVRIRRYYLCLDVVNFTKVRSICSTFVRVVALEMKVVVQIPLDAIICMNIPICCSNPSMPYQLFIAIGPLVDAEMCFTTLELYY